jgi:hypothetical protein
MFMHHYPLAADLPQANGQTKLQLFSFFARLSPGTAHQGSGKRHIIARRNIHLTDVKDTGILKPTKERIPGIAYTLRFLLIAAGGGTSNIKMPGECLSRIPSRFLVRTALAQFSIRSRVAASSVVPFLLASILISFLKR